MDDGWSVFHRGKKQRLLFSWTHRRLVMGRTLGRQGSSLHHLQAWSVRPAGDSYGAALFSVFHDSPECSVLAVDTIAKDLGLADLTLEPSVPDLFGLDDSERVMAAFPVGSAVTTRLVWAVQDVADVAASAFCRIHRVGDEATLVVDTVLRRKLLPDVRNLKLSLHSGEAFAVTLVTRTVAADIFRFQLRPYGDHYYTIIWP